MPYLVQVNDSCFNGYIILPDSIKPQTVGEVASALFVKMDDNGEPDLSRTPKPLTITQCGAGLAFRIADAFAESEKASLAEAVAKADAFALKGE